MGQNLNNTGDAFTGVTYSISGVTRGMTGELFQNNFVITWLRARGGALHILDGRGVPPLRVCFSRLFSEIGLPFRMFFPGTGSLFQTFARHFRKMVRF